MSQSTFRLQSYYSISSILYITKLHHEWDSSIDRLLYYIEALSSYKYYWIKLIKILHDYALSTR